MAVLPVEAERGHLGFSDEYADVAVGEVEERPGLVLGAHAAFDVHRAGDEFFQPVGLVVQPAPDDPLVVGVPVDEFDAFRDARVQRFAAYARASSHAADVGGEQLPVRHGSPVWYVVGVHVQSGQFESGVAAADVGWFAQCDGPLGEPSHERGSAVSLQPPSAALVRAEVVREVRGEDLLSGGVSEEFGLRGEFLGVVRRWGRGACQTVAHRFEVVDQHGAGLAGGLFEDRRLVQDDRVEHVGGERFDAFVVRDPYAVACDLVGCSHVGGGQVELAGFAACLLAYGQRGDDEPAPVEPAGPFELHHGLAQSGVGPDRGSAYLERP